MRRPVGPEYVQLKQVSEIRESVWRLIQSIDEVLSKPDLVVLFAPSDGLLPPTEPELESKGQIVLSASVQSTIAPHPDPDVQRFRDELAKRKMGKPTEINRESVGGAMTDAAIGGERPTGSEP